MSTPSAERGVVLLAAGQGSRMAPLTNETPKSMLQVNGVPLLQRILEQVLRLSSCEVVVVTGYRPETIDALVARRFPDRVRCVHNRRFAEDVNILSVALGVDSLRHSELGYTIIETDLLVERAAWELIFDSHRGADSVWVTRGRYGPDLTGGIVHADETGRIDAIDYRPAYDATFDGWHKMLGILSVSPECAARDRELRGRAIASTIRQYYLAPWMDHLPLLPCRVLDLGELFARSFNTPEAFETCCRSFLAVEPRAAVGCA